MKKLIILLFLTFLFSCWKEEVKVLNENKINTQILVQTWMTNNTWSEIKINTQTGNIVNTWSEEPKKEVVVKTIKKEWFNLFLYENDKKIDSLTTYWNSIDADSMSNKCWIDNTKYVSYKILWQDKNFWIVLKNSYICWMDQWIEEVYAMNFNNSKNELTNINDIITRPINFNEFEYSNGIITINIQSSNVVEWEWSRFEIWNQELKTFWFINNWPKWTKKLTLENLLPKVEDVVKQEPIKSVEKIQSKIIPKVGTYKHQEEWRNYTIITISNLKDNSFDFKYMMNWEAEIEDNDKSFWWFWTWKKDWNNWKLYINIEEVNDMSNCTAKIEFLPEWIAIKDKKDCEFYMMEWLYK